MNLPNKLTLSRIVMTLIMTVFLTFPVIPYGKSLALAFFILASLTDYVDGRIARNRGLVTSFGKLMDPVADKILVSAAFVSFAAIQQIVPAWVVVIIISREFMVTGLRMLAASKGLILQAGSVGKHKTIWHMIVIIIIMVGLALREDVFPLLPDNDAMDAIQALFHQYFDYVTYSLSFVAAVLAVLSGLVYLFQHRNLFSRDM